MREQDTGMRREAFRGQTSSQRLMTSGGEMILKSAPNLKEIILEEIGNIVEKRNQGDFETGLMIGFICNLNIQTNLKLTSLK